MEPCWSAFHSLLGETGNQSPVKAAKVGVLSVVTSCFSHCGRKPSSGIFSFYGKLMLQDWEFSRTFLEMDVEFLLHPTGGLYRTTHMAVELK